MATGASTADLAIILVDARNGVLPQIATSRIHRVNAGDRTSCIAVNKMDLVDYREEVFAQICAEFAECAIASQGAGDLLHTHERPGGR